MACIYETMAEAVAGANRIIGTGVDGVSQKPDNELIQARPMPAVLDDDRRSNHSVFSLWTATDDGWHHLETNADKSALESKVKSLKMLFTNKQFLIIPGASSPK